MKEFEELVKSVELPLRRQVYYRVANRADAEDVLQEALIRASRTFCQLRERERFKPWILTIARNCVSDYYRRRTRAEKLEPREIYDRWYARRDDGARSAVRETLQALPEEDRRILTRFYLEGIDQAELSRLLDIPIGTVKSRLHAARRRFRGAYPYPMRGGRQNMSIFPEYAPEIELLRLERPPFEEVVCEEMLGSFMAPRLGERSVYATYDFDMDRFPAMRKTGETVCEAVGEAEVHGLPCVEVREKERGENEGGYVSFERVENGRLETLAALLDGPVKTLKTFLDEDFQKDWGFSVEEGGEATQKRHRGIFVETGTDVFRCDRQSPWLEDAAGSYLVRIGEKRFDTLRVITVSAEGTLCERYITQAGKTVLFRRFNRSDWQADGAGFTPWTERLPESPRLRVNGDIYVLWYICLPEAAL